MIPTHACNNSEYKNQFLEFLRKNRPAEEQPKPSEIKVKKRKIGKNFSTNTSQK